MTEAIVWQDEKLDPSLKPRRISHLTTSLFTHTGGAWGPRPAVEPLPHRGAIVLPQLAGAGVFYPHLCGSGCDSICTLCFKNDSWPDSGQVSVPFIALFAHPCQY